ncbi:MAG: LamG-like jellyroll fold domain-containing protein, partial [Candidatus Heimdallarchaeota archaeon]
MSSQENPGAVWDDDYCFVLHMNQDPYSSDILDSTTNGFDFNVEALGSMTSEDLVDGQTGKAIAFDGVDDYIYLPVAEGLTGPTEKFTFEFWLMFPDGWTPSPRDYVGAPATASGDPYISFYDTFEFHIETDSGYMIESIQTTFSAGTWYHFSAVWDGTGLGLHRIYISGSIERDDSSPPTGNHVAWNTFSIGAEDDDSNGPGGSGSDHKIKATISEFRLSKVVRSAEWIATEFNNQDDPSSFYSIGKEYTLSGIPPNENFFKFYKKITIDYIMVSGTDDLINFPLLISLFDADLHTKAQLYGDDIAFAFNGAWLDHEIESFDRAGNGTHAQLISWVCIPRLSTSRDTIIRMYYGNATMSSRENSIGVWSSNYKGVWHLSESSGSALDSTTYSTTGSVSPIVTRDSTGKIASAYNFGDNGQINFGDPLDEHLDMGTGSFTISFWLNLDQSTSWYQLPLYKGATTQFDVGYDFETNTAATQLSFRICDDYENLRESPFLDIEEDIGNWIYITGVVDRTFNRIRIFKNGLQEGSGTDISSVGNINNDNPLYLSAAVHNCEIDGLMDEIRICSVQRSADWIATEYNNQNDPQSFLRIGLEESFDYIPPTYSNLIESSDPLELGNTEIITINVSDPSGINQVKIEFASSNHSMTNIGGDTWQYDSWVPSSVGNYTYTIWMEDNYNNWNSTVGTIEVIDTTPPTYSDLVESANYLQLGQNETISIKVYDSPGSGVNQVLLEYGPVPTNHTMVQAGNTWTWSKWKPALLGPHSYTIWMEDNCNNWNYTSGTITVVETHAPIIENLSKYDDPLELGNNITIMVDVFDEETNVSTVLIELGDINYTMRHIGGDTYGFNWTRSWVGIVIFVIYANDSLDNWNSYSSSFDIIDTTKPVIKNLTKSEEPLELGNPIIITVNCSDLSDIKLAKIEYLNSNYTMTNITGDIWEYDAWTPDATGNWSYTIWIEDNNNNWASLIDSILVQDTIFPTYSDLTESDNPVELGDQLIISINVTDFAGIKDVLIEFENSNNTMTNIVGDIWQHNSWMPNSIGNYTYKIHIIDNNENWNYAESSILFQD